MTREGSDLQLQTHGSGVCVHGASARVSAPQLSFGFSLSHWINPSSMCRGVRLSIAPLTAMKPGLDLALEP